MKAEADDWVQFGKVRARILPTGGLEVAIDGVTTQAKYYKPLVRDFFRRHFGAVRPAWGDFSVSIVMHYTGDPPWMDLDNLAKALLDSVTGVAFADDSQVARLLVERRPAEREHITLLAVPLSARSAE